MELWAIGLCDYKVVNFGLYMAIGLGGYRVIGLGLGLLGLGLVYGFRV